MPKNTEILLGLLFVFLLAGCSAERKNVLSKTYHNTTARYNAYFYANERIKEVEDAIQDNHKNNFNEFLKIFSDVDSGVINSLRDQLDEVIKKASIAIQRHPNSRWVDDSYILVGKSRYYAADFVNAIETFKYVNTKSEDDNARHEALVWLMRTFLDYNEENNAIAVSDYLKKEKLNSRNYRLLELTRAYLDEKREDYDEMIEHLVTVAPSLTRQENAARINFLIGQVYQQKGFDAEAFNYYDICLKYNPNYELSFYAKLNMAQVTELANQNDVKKTRRYFVKLLKDRKNFEFKDKIYYEMANFEIKQDDYDKAIEYYKSSVSSSVSNPRQKGYSYLRLGEIYFDHLKNYETAKAYYDSTVIALPKDDDLYASVSERQEILADFVDQINIIQLQDSLLTLADMDTTNLYAYLDEVIAEKQRLADEEAKNRLKGITAVNRSQTDIFNPFSNNTLVTAASGSTWYFYNQNAVGMGQTEFKRIWGDIPLEDHWRRSNKSSASEFEEEKQELITDIENPAENGMMALVEGNSREQYLASIPFTPEARQQALSKIETAYYNLGKIYNFQLDEKIYAAESFEILTGRFPDSQYMPEVLYLLYLIYKDLENDKYLATGNRLTTDFPNTTYAKLVLNPNYKEESNIASEMLKGYYKKAYNYYLADSIDLALATIAEGASMYPDNSFSDNVELLRIFLMAKTDGLYKYQYELQEFDNKFPESELLGYIEELLTASEDLQTRLATEKAIQYIPYFDQTHFCVFLYPTNDDLTDKIPKHIDELNKNVLASGDLKTGNLMFNDKYSMVLINQFTDRENALAYFQKLIEKQSDFEQLGPYKFYSFVISEDNFQILYQTKGLEEYLNFFHANYQ
ncbi:MAG: methyltransferase [Cyclobacteriaceae bacterium]|nr:methyltransferase [Cyclobacteriaceae bacterium]